MGEQFQSEAHRRMSLKIHLFLILATIVYVSAEENTLLHRVLDAKWVLADGIVRSGNDMKIGIFRAGKNIRNGLIRTQKGIRNGIMRTQKGIRNVKNDLVQKMSDWKIRTPPVKIPTAKPIYDAPTTTITQKPIYYAPTTTARPIYYAPTPPPYYSPDLANRGLVNCEWSDWSKCSKDCGFGIQTREIAVQAENGGKQCRGETTKHCHLKHCPVSILTASSPDYFDE